MLKKSKLSAGVTAFLDILGFGAQLDAVNEIEDIEAILEGIALIRSKFEHASGDESTRSIQRAYNKSVLAFSDSVIVNVPLVSEMTRIQGSFDALMSELHSMAVAQAECVNSGLFMRGGVDIGWWYRHKSVLVSTSMKGAYEQEGAACVPVIALTDDLLKFISKHPDRAAYAGDIEPVRRMVRHFEGEVGGKPVSVHHLDYIQIFADEIDGSPRELRERRRVYALPTEERELILERGRIENVQTWLAGHARLIELAHSRCRSPNVAAKYEWLASYHNDVAPYWTNDDPSCICVL